MKKLLGLLLIATAAQAGSVATNRDSMFLNANAPRNYVLNAGAEKNDAGVTDSSSIHSRSTSSPLTGVASHLIDGSGSSQDVDFAMSSFEAGLLGTQCEALFTVSGDASLYTATMRINSSDVTSAMTLPNTGTSSQVVSIPFPCGTSGVSPVLRITSTSASAAAIKMDDIYGGKAVSLGNVNVVDDPVAYTPTFTGFGTVSGVNFVSWREGANLKIRGTFTSGTSTSTEARITIGYKGVNESVTSVSTLPTVQVVGKGNLSANSSTTDFTERWPMVEASKTYLVFGAGYSTAGSGLAKKNGSAMISSGDVFSFFAEVPIAGWTTTSSYSLMNTYWKVDANISGANASLGTSAVSSYTGIENGSLTLTNNSGTGNIAAQIGCSSTNAPSGTTCSSGNESVAVAFTPLGTFPQDVLACFSGAWQTVTGATADNGQYAAFQIVETATNAQTIIQEGKSRVAAACETVAANSHECNVPLRVCGTFTFASPGQKMLRLMFEQQVAGTPASSTIYGDANATQGQRDMHWEVYPLSYNTPAPILVGGVTSSNTTGGEQINRANLNCDGSSSITRQSGSWVSSIGNISTGACAVTLASGVFSEIPTCTVSVIGALSGSNFVAVVNPTSTTNVSVDCTSMTSGSSTISDCAGYDFTMLCMGPR